MKLFFSAGEASGDILAAGFIRQLKLEWSHVEIVGVGSSAMQSAGMQLLYDMCGTASIGFVESLRNLVPGLCAIRRVKSLIRREKPDLLVLVDCPGINLVLARFAKKVGLPVVYFIPPQNYIWNGRRRGREIISRVDLFINIYKSGYKFYSDLGGASVYVGHPVLDLMNQAVEKGGFPLLKNRGGRYVMLVPGVRRQEIKYILPILIASAAKLYEEDCSLVFLLPAVDQKHKMCIQRQLVGCGFPWRIVEGDLYHYLRQSDFVITKSGTSSLDVAVAGVPFVVVYKLSALSAFVLSKILRIKKRVPYFSLPNILAGEKIVDELVQKNATVENIVGVAQRYLYKEDSSQLFKMRLHKFTSLLGAPGVYQRASVAIQDFVKQKGLGSNEL